MPKWENLELFAEAATPLAPPPRQRAELEADSRSEPAGEPALLSWIGADAQLDLFKHSPAEIAAFKVRSALRELAADRVRAHLLPLRTANAYAAFVDDAEQCLELIERVDSRWDDLAAAVTWTEHELAPAAERCLSHHASVLLRPALMALLERAGQASHPTTPRHGHPSHLWQMLGDPAQAAALLETDPLWREQAQTLSWHAELCELSGDHPGMHADVAELCVAFADEAEQWLGASRYWSARWAAWCDLDAELPMHAFPAWCRLTRAIDFPVPTATDTRPGAVLLRLALHLSRGTGVDLALRKSLQTLCPELLAEYLAQRATRGA